MKNKKLNLLILFVAMILVLYFTLKDDFHGIMEELGKVNVILLMLAFLLLLLSLAFKAASLKTFVKKHIKNYSFKNSYIITLIGQFINGITPFQSGGQPFQIYLLKKQGVRISDSTNLMLRDFIAYQIALILVGIISILINTNINITSGNVYLNWLILFGFLINLLVLMVLLTICFAKTTGTKMANKIIHFLFKFRITKKFGTTEHNVKKSVENFYKIGSEIKQDKKSMIKAIFYNLVHLILLYLIPFVIFKSFYVHSVSVLKSMVAISFVMLIGNFIPIPGATGGIEYGFLEFFKSFAKTSTLKGVMLLWRFVTYFLAMLIGFITLTLIKEVKKDENRIIY